MSRKESTSCFSSNSCSHSSWYSGHCHLCPVCGHVVPTAELRSHFSQELSNFKGQLGSRNSPFSDTSSDHSIDHRYDTYSSYNDVTKFGHVENQSNQRWSKFKQVKANRSQRTGRKWYKFGSSLDDQTQDIVVD
ncbi:hypothetical protein HDE_13922 [Halotydeus destructor]|nr:hypothetical protein HDE_13922 [Halotydeus destructor]